MPQRPHGELEMRRRLADEAARLIGEGTRDFQAALRKAAAQLGVRDQRLIPSRGEVEAALLERQRLFQSDSQPRALAARRETALEAMAFFAPFEPRLVGAVLEGYADELSAVSLHLFSDDAEAVLRFLQERNIPYEQEARKFRYGDGRVELRPVLRFEADGIPVELGVFERGGLREAPLERAGDRPVRRANRAAVAALVAGASTG